MIKYYLYLHICLYSNTSEICIVTRLASFTSSVPLRPNRVGRYWFNKADWLEIDCVMDRRAVFIRVGVASRMNIADFCEPPCVKWMFCIRWKSDGSTVQRCWPVQESKHVCSMPDFKFVSTMLALNPPLREKISVNFKGSLVTSSTKLPTTIPTSSLIHSVGHCSSSIWVKLKFWNGSK